MFKFIALLFLILCAQAQAQVKELVVPYGPGGAADSFARTVQEYYQRKYNQQLNVINKPGAGGMLGTQYALKESANGNRLVVANTGSLLFPKVFNIKQLYDYSDFFILAPYAQSPSVITVDSSIKSWKDLIEKAKTKSLNCGVSSNAGRVIGIYLFNQAGVKNVEMIRFAGSAEVITNMKGKHIDCGIDTLSTHYPHIKDGSFNVVAIGSHNKSSEFPNAILFKDIVPELTFYFWYGIAVDKNIDPMLKLQYQKQFESMHTDDEFIKTLQKFNLEPVGMVKDSQAWIDKQVQRYDRIRIELGINKE